MIFKKKKKIIILKEQAFTEKSVNQIKEFCGENYLTVTNPDAEKLIEVIEL